MSAIGPCKITFENGQTLEANISSLEVSYDYDNGSYNGWSPSRYDMAGGIEYVGSLKGDTSIVLSGILKEFNDIGGKTMCRVGYCDDSCSVKGEDPSFSGHELARKYKDLDLDEDEALLRKHEIVNLDGTVTGKGKELLMNLLMDEKRDEVVTVLEALDAAEKKKDC